MERSRVFLLHARRLLLAALLFPALLALIPDDAAAQSRADSAAVLLATATRLGNEGRGEVAEALYEYILQRFGDTPAAEHVRALRAASPAVGRAGRTELQVWSTLYGAWLGVAVPLFASADSPEPYGVGLLVGAPTGFFLSRAYANSRSLGVGQARAITLGGTWGTWQGFGWAEVFDFGRETMDQCTEGYCYEYETGDNTEERVGSAVAGGLAGVLTGALLSHKPISPGLATTVNFGALWGTWLGVAGGIISDDEFDSDDDHILTWALLGGDAGLVTTMVLGPRWQLSRNRARLISLAGMVGGIAGLGIDLLAQPDDEDVAVGIPLVTSLAGLGVGAWLTRSFDSGEGGDALPAGALLDIRGGRWDFGVPSVVPILQRDDRTGARSAAVHVPLLQAKF